MTEAIDGQTAKSFGDDWEAVCENLVYFLKIW
jgi:hypothetical protein